MNSRRSSVVVPLVVLLLASALVACGGESDSPKPAATPGRAKVETPAEAHPAWFVGRWVFDLEASTKRLDALGVAADAKPGDEGMTRGMLASFDAAGLEYELAADGGLSQVAKRQPAPDTRYRWRAVGADEVEFGPKPGTDLATQGFRPQRLRRVGDGLESFNPRLPIRTKGGEFRYLYKRAPK